MLTLFVGVLVTVLINLVIVYTYKRSKKITLETETEMLPPPVIYEEPDAIKPDPNTQGNVAYGHVQPLAAVSGAF